MKLTINNISIVDMPIKINNINELRLFAQLIEVDYDEYFKLYKEVEIETSNVSDRHYMFPMLVMVKKETFSREVMYELLHNPYYPTKKEMELYNSKHWHKYIELKCFVNKEMEYFI